MGNKNSSSSLDFFTRVYIQIALNLAKDNPTLDHFDEALRREVSEKTGICEGGVKYLHHAFHWEMFLNNNGSSKGYKSPLELVQPRGPGNKSYVRQIRVSNQRDVDRLTDLVLNNPSRYNDSRGRSYLEARFEKVKMGEHCKGSKNAA